MNRRIVLCVTLLASIGSAGALFAQEALKSTEEDYYDFLSLTGTTTRNFMLYRTLQESRWAVGDDDEQKHVWAEKNLGAEKTLWKRSSTERNWFTRGFNNGVTYKLYGAEWFSSYNSAAPFGQNDGGLWQGRGFNTAVTGGGMFSAYGFTLSIRPQLSFSQNKDYDYYPSDYRGYTAATYAGKAHEYGYLWGQCDAVHRFGDGSFRNFDWGDTEIRYTWHTLTVGFGTEAIWIGPAFLNPVLHSNNAPTYPKLDFGLQKTRLTIPHFGWYLGDIETRLWVGYLTESDYFDNDSSNDHNQLSGFTFAYAPSFIPGLTLGVTKITISKWGDDLLLYAYPGFYGNTLTGSKSGRQGEDQKASITADWLFTKVGLEMYGELGFDDFLADGMKVYEYLRYPLHTITYTVGVKKTFELSKAKKLRGVLQMEWNNTEGSQDYQLWSGSGYNFGFHGQITQGYTNRGQWLGSGIGYGGNSQFLSFTVYSPHGYEKFFVARNNPDNNYVYYKAVDAGAAKTTYNGTRYFTAFKANFYIGFENLYYIFKNLSVRYGFCYNLLINPTYEPGYNTSQNAWRDYSHINNYNVIFALTYHF